MKSFVVLCLMLLFFLSGCLEQGVTFTKTKQMAEKWCESNWRECQYIGHSQRGDSILIFYFNAIHGGVLYERIEYVCFDANIFRGSIPYGDHKWDCTDL